MKELHSRQMDVDAKMGVEEFLGPAVGIGVGHSNVT